MLGKDFAHHRRIYARHRNIGAKTIDNQSAKREPDTLLQLGRLGEHTEVQIGHRLFHGGRHAHSPKCAERPYVAPCLKTLCGATPEQDKRISPE